MINTEPINKQDVLIRLIKDGHIRNEEFVKVFAKLLRQSDETMEF